MLEEIFYALIKNLCYNSTGSVRNRDSQAQPFQYARGVRQDCILSPPLFNLCINDLSSSFENILSDPFVLPNGAKLSSLLYADDLIILSRSKAGLLSETFSPLWSSIADLGRPIRTWGLNGFRLQLQRNNFKVYKLYLLCIAKARSCDF